MARNVIYYNASNPTIPLAGIANLPYTHVIVGFLIPDSIIINLIGDGSAFGGLSQLQQLQTDIKTLQGAGKSVLISVGGQVKNPGAVGYSTWTGWTSAKYKQCNLNVLGLVEQIVFWVNTYGFNGVGH
jgi:hypothetical protein